MLVIVLLVARTALVRRLLADKDDDATKNEGTVPPRQQ